MTDSDFSYPHPPFGQLATLARALGIGLARLDLLAASAGSMYHDVIVRKKDGSARHTHAPAEELKAVQRRIVEKVFHAVSFPSWVNGSIRGRDAIGNAALHVNSRDVINLDVADFFPSITEDRVRDIWQGFFHFPVPVANCLTRISTLDGSLPQGAPTSNYLANLVFWKSELKLVEKLAALGFRYSRYVDDITLSRPSDATPEQTGSAIGLVRIMLSSYSLRLKNRKTRIARSGQRKMVTGAVVSKKLGATREKKSQIRALIRRVADQFELDPESEQFRKDLASASSSVGQLSRLSPGKAGRLKAKLHAIRSHLK